MRPGKLTNRDEAVLRHIGLYRLTLRATLSRALFSGNNPANVITRLRAAGLIQERDGLPGGVGYYQLTNDGARHRVPLVRTRAFDQRALSVHLGVLWFATMTSPPRTRLEDKQLRALFGDSAPRTGQTPHVLEVAPDGNPDGNPAGKRRILRLYVPGRRSTNASLVRALTRDIDRALAGETELASWVKTRAYGFSVLVDMPEREATLRELLGRLDIHRRAFVSVHLTVSVQTLLSFLDAARRDAAHR